MQNLDFKVEELTDQHKQEMEKHADFKQSNIKEHYDELSTNYE